MELSNVVRPAGLLAAAALPLLLSACAGAPPGTAAPAAARTTTTAQAPAPASAPAGAASVAGAGQAAAPATVASTAIVPWANTPGAPQQPAAAVPAARPCAAADLEVVAGQTGAFQGEATQELTLRDRGAAGCFLAGAPQALLPDMGARSRVSTGRFAGTRLDLAPGQTARILIGTPGTCAGAGQPAVASSVQVTLPDGDAVAVGGTHIDTRCGAPAVLAFEAAAPPAPAPGPLSTLDVSIAAPGTVARGTVLTYHVTVANHLASAVALSPCPSYTETLGAGDSAPAQQTLLLNCQGGGSIAAGASLTFEIRLSVPASTAAGTTKLTWALDVADGPVVGAAVTVS